MGGQVLYDLPIVKARHEGLATALVERIWDSPDAGVQTAQS